MAITTSTRNDSQTPVSPWLIAFTVLLATFMEVLDTSVANVALPHIAGSLSSSLDESTWVLTSYLVSNAIVLPLSGWFSTLIGRKRFYMTCVGLFTLSSFLCGLAPSLTLLVFFRILQGVGGGAMQPVSQAILVESFPKEKQGIAMALYGIGVVLAPVIGPTLGGWITDNYTWRWIFFINIPIGILSLLMTSALVADPVYLVRRKFSEMKMDYVGLALLSIGLGALEVTLDEGQRDDWFGSHFIILFASVAAIALISLVIWEIYDPEPVVDFRVLKDRNLAVSTATMFALGIALYGSTVLIPLYLQTLMNYTATLSGLALSPGGLAIALLMPVVGFLLTKVEARWLVLCGIIISSGGMLLMSRVDLATNFGTVVGDRICQSLGFGFLFVPINTLAFSYIPKEKTNQASGMINLARNIGGSAGIALVTTMLDRRAQMHQNYLDANLTPLNTNYLQHLTGIGHTLATRGATAADAMHRSYGLMYGLLLRQSNMLAVIDTLEVLATVLLLMAPLLFFIRKPRGGHASMMLH